MSTIVKEDAKVDVDELLRLDNQLCFALYAATRALSKTYRKRLDPIGITYPQYLVLITLWEQDGLTVSEIGRRLRLDSGTLTPLLQRLEAAKLIERRRGTTDEREVHAHLTAEGSGLKNQVASARHFVGCQLGLSDAEVKTLRSDIMQLVAHLDANDAVS